MYSSSDLLALGIIFFGGLLCLLFHAGLSERNKLIVIVLVCVAAVTPREFFLDPPNYRDPLGPDPRLVRQGLRGRGATIRRQSLPAAASEGAGTPAP
mmetsp:Transcript_103438/g.297203  ORF Transcript_103438/g.297203 Transcript_103438/m.297203 type:complete len:97 (+) Transcript_103438:1182-1472(+)